MFISKFSRFNGAAVMFTEGMCYWFAHILNAQFGGEIHYLPIVGHFVAKIEGVIYDITGDVTDKYAQEKSYEWDFLQEYDPKWASNIKRDCVDKIDYYSGGKEDNST
jgi:hypothetical protein